MTPNLGESFAQYARRRNREYLLAQHQERVRSRKIRAVLKKLMKDQEVGTWQMN